MTLRRPLAALLAHGALAGALAAGAPVAAAEPAPQWTGWYQVTFHTDRKTGSSPAAAQSEIPYTVWYRFGTDCSSGGCVASVLDGPTTKGNVAEVTTFDWTGTQWSRTNEWRWDCLLPDKTITYDPARSVTSYTPRPDGSLAGTFATTITGGACAGTVDIPVSAVPADPPAAR